TTPRTLSFQTAEGAAPALPFVAHDPRGTEEGAEKGALERRTAHRHGDRGRVRVRTRRRRGAADTRRSRRPHRSVARPAQCRGGARDLGAAESCGVERRDDRYDDGLRREAWRRL